MAAMNELLRPEEPVKVALIGAGNRASTLYGPLLPDLIDWVQVTACCDPVAEHREAMAAALGARPYADVRDLVRDEIAEAALVVTPVPSHFGYSVYLSSHGVHNMTETSWCSLVDQGREMIRLADDNGVVVRVAENFFRFECDRFAQTVKDSGFLGRIGRIFSYADHTGYHNNSRWIRLYGHPTSCQSITHAIDTPSFRSQPHRFHRGETFGANFFTFADGELVSDQLANGKGFLGRHPRPGYTEWQGDRGTLLCRAADPRPSGDGATSAFTAPSLQLRRCSDAGIDPEKGVETIRAVADEIIDVAHEDEDGSWTRTYADTSAGRIEYASPFRCSTYRQARTDYGPAAMSHIVDFALAVRGLQVSEFDAHDALMSLMMCVGCDESARNDGRKISLPLDGDTETETEERAALTHQHGVDPMDVEGMIAFSYARP